MLKASIWGSAHVAVELARRAMMSLKHGEVPRTSTEVECLCIFAGFFDPPAKKTDPKHTPIEAEISALFQEALTESGLDLDLIRQLCMKPYPAAWREAGFTRMLYMVFQLQQAIKAKLAELQPVLEKSA